MRFRKQRNKKPKTGVEQLSRFQKLKAMNYFRKELRKIGKTPEDVQKRIAVFYEVYNKQYPICLEKLKESKKLKHIDNYNRILSFKNDIENVKIKMDRMVFDMENDKTKDKSLLQKVKKTRIGTFILLFRDLNNINMRYKKEDCDIDNFEV